MHFQKITIAIVAAASASAFACSGVRDASAKSATPDLQPATAQRIDDSHTAVLTRRDTIPPVKSKTDTTKATTGAHPTPPVLDSLINGTLPARGLYVFRYAANPRRMKKLLAIADSTEINAFVIDVKDEFGLNFKPSDPMLKKNAAHKESPE